MKYNFLNQITFSFSLVILFLVSGCQKSLTNSEIKAENLLSARNNQVNGHLKQTKTYSSEVVTKWLDQQLSMFKLPLPAGTSAASSDRVFAYSGIALYEAVKPGMPGHKSLSGQLTDFPLSSFPLPVTEPGLAYHWAASANAALAEISKKFFSGRDNAIDQLQHALHTTYMNDVDAQTLQRSEDFGKAVAHAVWEWAKLDGQSVIMQQSPFVVPADAPVGSWVPTSAGSPANAYHRFRRLMVNSNEHEGSQPLAIAYSTNPTSDYYKMAKEVYDISKNLTQEQRNIALYHREGPAVNGGSFGGGSSIAGQLAAVLRKADATLDVAAEAYAKAGMGSYDGLTITFRQKYQFLTMRPITYIRANIDATWNTVYGTPLYPEYPAGHPTNGGMLAVMLTSVFGNNFPFSVDYYSNSNFPGNGLPARHYNNFEALAQEMAIARVYSGIHFKPGVYEGVGVGKRVAMNILNQVTFKD